MIIDKNTHCFDNCPTCKGMAIWLNDNLASPAEANRLQVQECISYCDRNGIKVSRKERRRLKEAV